MTRSEYPLTQHHIPQEPKPQIERRDAPTNSIRKREDLKRQRRDSRVYVSDELAASIFRLVRLTRKWRQEEASSAGTSLSVCQSAGRHIPPDLTFNRSDHR